MRESVQSMDTEAVHSSIRFLFVVGLIPLLAGAVLGADPSILERSPVKTIYIVQLAHLDIGFTDTQAAVAKVSAETIDRAIELCGEDPDYRWTIESLWQLEQWMKGKSAEQIGHLMSLVKDGRISLSACYAGMLSGLMGSEEVCRSMYFAERLRREHGVSIVTAVQNDIPGCSWAYPQAFRRSGVKYFLMGVNNFIGAGADIPVKDRPFYWEGPDGSRVLTWICSDFIGKESGYLLGLWEYGWGKGGRAEETVPKLLERLEETGYPYDSILIIAGTGDNGGTNLSMVQGAGEWNSKHASPKMVIAAPEEFFAHMESKYRERFPVYRGDWSGLWDQIAQSVPYGMALSRRVHDELPAAEVLASFAEVFGFRAYPKGDLDIAWENVITFDEHSGGGGWPGTLTREQTLEGNVTALGYAKAAFKSTAGVRRRALEALSSEVRVSADGVFVWNPTPRNRTGFARVRLDEKQFYRDFDLVDEATGLPVPCQKIKPTREIVFQVSDVPGLGYKTLALKRGSSPILPLSHSPIQPVTAGPNCLENSFLRLEVGESGLVTSLCDKRTGGELVDGKSRFGFGQLVQAMKGKCEPVVPEKPSVRVGLTGPLTGSLVITDPRSPLARTEITLNAGEPVVRFSHAFDLRRTPHASHDQGAITYDIAYPLDMPEAERVFDTPAGLLDPKTDYMPKAFRIVNVHHGGDITGPAAGVTFASRQAFNWEFRQMNWLWGTPIPPDSTALMMRLLSKCDEAQYKEGVGKCRTEPGAPNVLAYESAFLVHSGRSEFDPEAAEEFLASEANPLLAVPLDANPKGSLPRGSGQLLTLEGAGFSLLAFKKAEDGDGYVLRIIETAGRGGRARTGSGLLRIRAAELLDTVERPIRRLSVARGMASLGIKPREIVTLRLRFGKRE